MKTQTNFKSYLTRLRGQMLNLGYHSVVTQPSRSGLHRTLTIILLLLCIGVGNAWGAVTALSLPKSWDDSNGKSAYTEALGCTFSGLGSDYSSSPKLKFDGAGDYLKIQVADSPNQISFKFKQNGSNAGTFKVQESDDDNTYTDALTVSWPGNGKTSTQNASLKSSTRYIKLIFVTKGNSTNAAVGGISITKAAAACTTSPTVGAGANSAVTATGATVSCPNGITSLGSAGCSISSYGFVIGTSSNPSVGGNGVTKHEVGTTYSTTGTSFSKNLTGLSASTTYYIRPYATNGNGTGYGTQTSFTTSAPPKYTVTLKDDDTELVQATADASVTLPSRAGCAGYTFAGWTKSWATAQTTWTTTAPTIIPAGSYKPTANENLYPVYTKTEGGGSVTWTQVTSVAVGDEVVIAQVDDGTKEMIGFNTTVTTANNYGTSESFTTNPAGTMIWTVEAGSGSNQFSFKNGNYYLNLASNNNYLNGSETKNANSSWTVSSSSSRAVVTNASQNTRKIMWNKSSPRFASYAKNHGNNSGSYYYHIVFYKKSNSSTTSYISVPNCCTALGTINGSVNLTQVGVNTLKVSGWSEVSNASSYTVKLYKKNGASWDPVSGTAANGNSGAAGTRTGITNRETGVTYSGLTYGATYKFTVTAIGNGSTYCDGEETAATSINGNALTNNEFLNKFAINIDDGTNNNYALHYIESLSDGNGSVGITLNGNTDYYQFKLTLGSVIWWGNTGKMTDSNCTDWTFTNADNCKLQTVMAGTYTFNVAVATPKVSVVYASANQAAGHKIYWDNSVLGWSTFKYRIGNTGHNQNQGFTLVPGTDQFYVTTTPAYNSMAAWHIANNTSWSGSNSIYKTKTGDGYAITNAIAFQQATVTGDITVIPTTTHSTGGDDQNNNCEFYTITSSSGMLTHTATITTPTNGTITIAYTDVNSTAQSKTATTAGLAHRTILTITATPATGYNLTSLKVNGTDFTSGNTHILAADATIAATFTAKTYDVTLDREGATTGSTSVTMTYNSSTHTAITAPTKTGYTFGGWWSGDNGTGSMVMNASGVLQANVSGYTGAGGIWTKDATCTLYAKWTPINYTLTWNLDGGTVTTAGTGAAVNATGTPNSSVAYGTAITAPVVTKTGYNFTGWSPSVASTMPAAATTYTAQWELKKYTVTWHVGESTSTMNNVTHGTTFSTLEASAPAHADNALAACGSTKFIGWVKASGEFTEDGKTVDWYNTHKFSGSDEITADTHVYAMYAEASGGVSTDYELYSGTLTEGDYIIYYDGKAMKNTITSSRFDYSEVTPSENTISDPAATIIWHIAPSGDYWTIYNSNVSKYAGGTTSKNQGALLDAGTGDYALWTCSSTAESTTYDFVNKGRAGGGSDTGNKYLRNNGTYGFACYASGTGGALSLYKLSVTYSNYRTGCTVSCGAPLSLTNNSITKTGATIGWTGGDNGTLSKYEYAVWVDGDTEPTSGFTNNGTNTSKALTGLYSGIKYNWKVRKVCTGSDGESRWSYSSFTTTAATLNFSVPTGVAAVSSQASDLNLPEAGVPTSCGSCWAFAGWTANTTYSDADAPADLMAAGTKARVSGDKTLYAVYKNDRFQMIYETSDMEVGKDYVVTFYDSPNEYALSNAVSPSYASDAAPVDITSLTRETGEGYFIFNPTEAVIWSFSGTTSSGQLYNAAANNYVNLTGSGCVVSTTDNLTFSVNGDAEWTISSTKYLRYYSTTSFDAVSTESDNTKMYIYKRVETSYATDPACDAYTVTWMRDKVAISGFESQSVTQCEGITTLPGTQTKLTCSDVHVGWSASEIMPASDVRPADFFTRAEDAPEITGNTTFYAVFADQSVGAATATNTTYTFNSAAWGDATNSWNSTTAGNQLTANQGIQILGGASAVGVTKEEYSAVTKVIVTYCTNSSKGTGSIAVKVGDTSYGSNDVTKPASGGQTLKTFEYIHAATDGKVTITASATTNSIYIYSVQIFYTGSGTTYSNYRTSCCNNSNFTFGSIADPVTEYVIVREDLESASDAVEMDCNYQSANTTGAIAWYSTRRAALGFPATGAYTWTTPSSQPTGLNIDVANKKISATATGVWTITLSQVSANNYCPADAVVTVRVKTLDKFIDNVNGNFGGDAQAREDVGDGIVLPTEAEFSTNNGCADGKVRRLVGWIKASDLATYRTSGRINTIDDLKTADASNKVIAPGTRVSATGCTWYAVWGTEQ